MSTKRKQNQSHVLVDEWTGCYGESWQGAISPAAISHPAKFSRALIRRIYDHVIAERWAAAGSSIVDPFGGVALGAWEAMQRGMLWWGSELEPRFVMLGQGADCDGHTCPDCSAADPEDNGQSSMFAKPERAPHRYHGNIERWEEMRLSGTARLFNGDSRRLSEVIGAADIGVTSPPYNPPMSQDHNGARGGQRGTTPSEKGAFVKYGNTEGQLEGMSMEGHDLALSSPPYSTGVVKMRSGSVDAARLEAKGLNPKQNGMGREGTAMEEYGRTEGQLAAFPEGNLDVALTSPPYATGLAHAGKYKDSEKALRDAERDIMKGKAGASADMRYSADPANIANLKEGDVDLVFSSPPYGQRTVHGQSGIDLTKNPNDRTGKGSQIHTQHAYGISDANLGNLPAGEVALDLAIASPPYVGSQNAEHNPANMTAGKAKRGGDSALRAKQDYAPLEAPGQLTNLPVGDIDLALTSPPFLDARSGTTASGSTKGGPCSERILSVANGDLIGQTDGQLSTLSPGDVDAVISSPPYPQPHSSGGGINKTGYGDGSDKVGERSYQGRGGDRDTDNLEVLANEGFDAAIASPPFENIEGSQAGRKHKNPAAVAKQRAADYRSGKLKGHAGSEKAILAQLERENGYNYGTDPANLGNMKGGFNQAITSPPYEASNGHPSLGSVNNDDWGNEGTDITGRRGKTGAYSDETTNLGNQRGETFWSASRTILEELFKVLKPGGHAVFVTKRFVRGGKIVDFPGQWSQLCQAVGFEFLHDHHALLTEEHGSQHTLEGEVETKTVARKSFFRRLAEAHGSPSIDFENVQCFRKPL